MAKAPPLGVCTRAIVDDVVDGDTIKVHLMFPVTVRLLDCWAPEIRGAESDLGIKAMNALKKLLPQGTEILVNVPTEEARSVGDILTFGRVLGQAWLRSQPNRSVSEFMVDWGHASTVKKRWA